MNTERYQDILGPQNDGEPAVYPPAPVDPPADPPKVEDPPADPPADPDPPVDPPHKKTGSQRARERAERETALRIEAEKKVAELEAKLKAPEAVADANEPDINAFEDFASWKVALSAYHEKKATESAEARVRAEQTQREQESKQRSWKEADAKFGATKPDWDDVLEDLRETVQDFTPQNAPGFHALDMALSASDHAPQLKYHLGKNPDELRRLAALDPIQAVVEFTKLSMRLGEIAPAKARTTNAPAPIDPLRGSSTAVPAKHRRDTYIDIN